jgi:hypothetical protein
MNTWPRVFRVAPLAVALGVTGCHHKVSPDSSSPTTVGDDDTSFAEDAADANATESDSELTASSLVSSAATGSIGLASTELTADDLSTETLGDGAKAIYLPRGCLRVNETLTTVTYVFASCGVGPNGLGNLDGTLTVKYRATELELHLDISATGFRVNRATVDIAASADVTTSAPGATDRKLVWAGEISGVTGGGREFTLTTSETVAWTLGEACFSLDGESEGQIRKRDIKIEISGFRRCRQSCPDPGGKIVVTNVAKDRQVTLAYDGTNKATFTGPGGRETQVPLFCSP